MVVYGRYISLPDASIVYFSIYSGVTTKVFSTNAF